MIMKQLLGGEVNRHARSLPYKSISWNIFILVFKYGWYKLGSIWDPFNSFHIICNDLFSRFEQQILFLEKQAEATNPTTDRHGHDGPSQGLVSKHLENLKLGTENWLSELRNGVAGRTITGVTDRHRPFTQNQVSELSDGQQDGPSQAERTVAGATARHSLRNPSWSWISG